MSESSFDQQDATFSSRILDPEHSTVTEALKDERANLEQQRQLLVQEVKTSATDEQLLSMAQNMENKNVLRLDSPAYEFILSEQDKVPSDERKEVLARVRHDSEANIRSINKNQELYACAFSLINKLPVPEYPESLATIQRRIANGESLQDILDKSLQNLQYFEDRLAKKRQLGQIENQLQQLEPDLTKAPNLGLAQANEYLNNHTIQGPVKDGFKDGGKSTSFDAQGNAINPTREVIVVDRTRDQQLQRLITQAQEIKDKYGSGYRAVFEISKLVYQRMDSPYLLQNDEQLVRKGGEVLIGDIESGVCRHRSLLFQTLASEIDIDSKQIRGMMATQGTIDQGAHAWNEVQLNGDTYVVDVMNPPVGNFASMDYDTFMRSQGFPKPGDKRLGWIYTNAQGTNTYTTKLDSY